MMKKYQLLILAFFIYLSSEAQNEKGAFQIGLGGLPIVYIDNSAPTGYSLRANIGYFPINNLSIGILPYIGKVDNIKSVGTNIYLRYYLINAKFSLFTEISSGLGNLKYDGTSQYDGTMNSIIVGPGAHYMIKNKLSIELLVQYARLKNISYPENTLVSNTFIPTIGIQYFINK
jgi:hypothetical protein